jgi:ketosteroid isomerase-like protein
LEWTQSRCNCTTGEHNGKKLDQDVVNALTIRDGKVANVSANLSDVSAFDAYFS